MGTDAEPFPISADPIHHRAPPGLAETSPHKFEKLSHFDGRKHGDPLQHIAAIDRPLLGASSMGHTVLVDMQTFERDILRLQDGLVDAAKVSDAFVNHARLELRSLFDQKTPPPTEDSIGKKFISIINNTDHGGLCKAHRTLFTGNKYADDATKSKVDAEIYPAASVPVDGKPDWTHIRLFIEFKRNGPALDPFDDAKSDAPEADAESRKAIRNQLINYALVIRNQQHRLFLYSLFVNGPEFRLMRWDHAGIIVTKKRNYAQDPRLLLSFLAWFDSLSDEQQGLDPTARLLKKTSRAYMLMDELARNDPSDMLYEEGSSVPAAYTAPQLLPSGSDQKLTNSAPAHNTRARSKQAAMSANKDFEDESYLDAIDLDGEDPRVFSYVRERFRDSLKDDWPRYRLEVGEEKRIFLVGKPMWVSFWMFGRGTRGYVALDVKTRRFVFLKDSWRPFYVGVEPEGYYLQLLASGKGADPRLRVPTVVVHGDVTVHGQDRGHLTLTPLFARHLLAEAKKAIRATSRESASSALRPIDREDSRGIKTKRPSDEESLEATLQGPKAEPLDAADTQNAYYRHHTHYRIVVQDVCLPFSSIRSSKQLVQLLRDCIQTHAIAYEQHRLLHRDVSAGNLIIQPSLSSAVDANGMKKVEWHGIITDWELAKTVPAQGEHSLTKPQERPRQPERTGTWQFMSVAYVQNHPRWAVSVADELESFFHVMLFYAVRLFHHNVENVASFVFDYYEFFSTRADARRQSSPAKIAAMTNGVIRTGAHDILKFTYANGKPHRELNNVFKVLLRYFKARYEILYWEQEQRQEAFLAAQNDEEPPSPIPEESDEELALRTLIRTQARKLDTHETVLSTLSHALDPERRPAPHWPEKDAVPDRLPESYDARELATLLNKMYSTTAMATGHEGPEGAPARKKARTEASEPEMAAAESASGAGQGGWHSVDALSARVTAGRKVRGKVAALD
ncbi:hypothetical protein BN946_scf185011.g37 [Trametes cinnabarina]|uniref:Fungal-type protein kinase domain-containing protein n=1 Tax=Pycnoporus cinnabarinus TaxID=5643 RepID=A0A060SV94_PYCCI|nr:hypothetical protein BN946_scf185011.g37 [Trametes cinnabarina]